MDNITHSIIGLALGEAVAVYQKKARLPIWIASAVANNLPDLDVLLTTFVFRGGINRLLHHRGYTHTLIVTPVLALLMMLGLYYYWRKKPDMPWKEMFAVALLGGPLHLLADSWNSYGVHPFWPFFSGWFYGDMIFIVEPWLWVLLLPPIYFACATRWGKGICLFLLGAITGLSWYHALVPWPAALLLTVAVATGLLGARMIRSAGLRITLAISLVVISLTGMRALSSSLHQTYGRPGAELALNPYPANPFCWWALRADVDAKEYRAEIFGVAPFPSVFPENKCAAMISPHITAPLQVSSEPDTSARKSYGVFRAPRAELDELSRDCRANAFLRFARIPFWKKEGDSWIVGDLRFDRDENLGFGEFLLRPEDKNCPRGVPPWVGRFHPDHDGT